MGSPGSLWDVLRSRKRLWAWPLLIAVVLLVMLLVVKVGSALAPFLYETF